MMGDLTRSFSRKEFTCKCGCGFDSVDIELIGVLQLDIRDFFKSPVIVTSGCRCFTHNMAEGGSRNSKHIESKAADIIVVNVLPLDVYNRLDDMYPDRFGLGLYGNRIHIDVRAIRARWGLSI